MTRPLFRPDPGWLFVVSGVVLLAGGLLVPAQMEMQGLRRQLTILQHDEVVAYQRLQSYAEFHGALIEGDPVLVRRLGASQLNLVPAGSRAVLRGTPGDVPVTSWIEAGVRADARPAPTEFRSSLLSRWSTGPHRLWLFALAIMSMFLGVLIAPSSSAERQADAESAASRQPRARARRRRARTPHRDESEAIPVARAVVAAPVLEATPVEVDPEPMVAELSPIVVESPPEDELPTIPLTDEAPLEMVEPEPVELEDDAVVEEPPEEEAAVVASVVSVRPESMDDIPLVADADEQLMLFEEPVEEIAVDEVASDEIALSIAPAAMIDLEAAPVITEPTTSEADVDAAPVVSAVPDEDATAIVGSDEDEEEEYDDEGGEEGDDEEYEDEYEDEDDEDVEYEDEEYEDEDGDDDGEEYEDDADEADGDAEGDEDEEEDDEDGEYEYEYEYVDDDGDEDEDDEDGEYEYEYEYVDDDEDDADADDEGEEEEEEDDETA